MTPDAFEDPEPVEVGEYFRPLADDPAGGAVHVDALGERVGQCDLSALLPERRVVAPRKAVVQDEEVTNTFELVGDEGVVARNIRGVKLLVREVIEQIEQCVGDEMQVGGGQRLEKTRSIPQRYHVLVPGFPAHALDEFHAGGAP